MKSFIHILEIIINPAIIGIIGATTGAIVGSITTARIETTRHKNEENKKSLRNLYFKIYTELDMKGCQALNLGAL
jgi:ABC-type lipoprotein release transport system permease subunit